MKEPSNDSQGMAYLSTLPRRVVTLYIPLGIFVVVLLFGPRQLPKLGRSLGETIREFRGIKKSLNEASDEVNKEVESLK